MTVLPESILAELVEIMERRGIELRWERFGGDSGCCTLQGKPVVFLDPGMSSGRAIRCLARELNRWDWGNVYLKPRIRALLENPEPEDES